MPRLDLQSRDIWSWRHKIMGDAWARLGILPAAEAEYLAGIKVNPKRVEPRASLGNFLTAIGDWENAEMVFRGALQLEPRNRILHFEIARTLRQQGAFAEADSIIPTGVVDGVPRTEYLLVRAGILIGLGRTDDAESLLEEAVELAPESGDVQNDLGVLYLQQGDTERAREALQKAVELQPDLSEAWANLGLIALQSGRLSEAEENLTNAIENGASNSEIGYSLGIARMNLQNLVGAEEILRRNLSEWPQHADSYMALGIVLERRELNQEAIRIYERGRLMIPDDPRFIRQLRRLWDLPPGFEP
jgi:Flp pilus assembly protein TadD